METAYLPINWWMDKENMGNIYNEVLFRHIEEWNHVVCRKMNGTRNHHVKQNKSDSERQILQIFFNMWKLDQNTKDMSINGGLFGGGTSGRGKGKWEGKGDMIKAYFIMYEKVIMKLI
jgi:hypothetical protein